MIKVVLLDVDGVIVNSEMWSNQLSNDYGIDPSIVDPFFRKEFQDCLNGKTDLKETIAPYLKKWGWEKSVDELLEYWFKAEHKIFEPLVVYIQNLRLKGFKCYLATNQERHRTKYLLDQMGFEDRFDGIFASANIGYQKSKKEFFEHILNALEPIQNNEILFWDNSLEHLEVAKKVGILTEHYTTFGHFKFKMAQYLNQPQ